MSIKSVFTKPASGLSHLVSRRGSWYVLAFVLVALLAYGSIHPATATQAARIRYLDSVIKCPECDDISIAQSNIVEAQDLKAKVAALVQSGETNAEVENYVVGRFGTAEIIVPSTRGVDATIWIVPLIVLPLISIVCISRLYRRRRFMLIRASDDDDEALVASARRDAAHS
jgi:cytochrome c-type biogenesis protein CcmH